MADLIMGPPGKILYIRVTDLNYEYRRRDFDEWYW
jgi:hypothetical protein